MKIVEKRRALLLAFCFVLLVMTLLRWNFSVPNKPTSPIRKGKISPVRDKFAVDVSNNERSDGFNEDRFDPAIFINGPKFSQFETRETRVKSLELVRKQFSNSFNSVPEPDETPDTDDKPPEYYLHPGLVPAEIHFLWCRGGDERPKKTKWFEYKHYLAVMSSLRTFHPDKVYMHFEKYPEMDRVVYHQWLMELKKEYPWLHMLNMTAEQIFKFCISENRSSKLSVIFELLNQWGGFFVGENTWMLNYQPLDRRLDFDFAFELDPDGTSDGYVMMRAGYYGKFLLLQKNTQDQSQLDYPEDFLVKSIEGYVRPDPLSKPSSGNDGDDGDDVGGVGDGRSNTDASRSNEFNLETVKFDADAKEKVKRSKRDVGGNDGKTNNNNNNMAVVGGGADGEDDDVNKNHDNNNNNNNNNKNNNKNRSDINDDGNSETDTETENPNENIGSKVKTRRSSCFKIQQIYHDEQLRNTSRCVVVRGGTYDSFYPMDIWQLDDPVGRLCRKVFYGSERIRLPVPSYDTLVPNIGHMIWIGGREMDYVFYLSVLSLLFVAKVDTVYIHGDIVPPGPLWQELMTLPQTKDRIKFITRTQPNFIYQEVVQKYYYSLMSDLIRVDLMIKYGGVYTDTDAIWVKPLSYAERGYDAVASYDWIDWSWPFQDTVNFGISYGKKHAPFWKVFRNSMRKLYNDVHGFTGVMMPYKLLEKYPEMLRIDRRLSVICYHSKCHPTYYPGYHDESKDHTNTNSISNWRRDVHAFHWTHPNPSEYFNRSTLLRSSGIFAELGRNVLMEAGLL